MKYFPSSETEAQEILEERLAARDPIRIVGGGTRGNYDFTACDTISASLMTGIVKYDPADGIMTAKAGTPLRHINEVLAKNGQCLAFEPMDHRPLLGTRGEPTIGGTFLSNSSGPAAFTAGSARDHLVGMRFVDGRSRIITFDGPRMSEMDRNFRLKSMAGSRGELGFVTELTFRVTPRQAFSSTVAVVCANDERAAEIMAHAVRLPLAIDGAAFVPPATSEVLPSAVGYRGAVLLRIRGATGEIKAQRSLALRDNLKPYGDLHIFEGEGSDRLWEAVGNVRAFARDPSTHLWRIEVNSAAGHKFCLAMKRIAKVEVIYDWQGGLVWLQAAPNLDGLTIGCEVAAAGGGHTALVRGRAHMPRFDDLTGQAGDVFSRMKAEFDPHRLLVPAYD
ncbi:FAD-binding protein [Rhizobium sp. BK060]|uniref:FAD-binding protein n=1 Tax=Rhizobium sp. BK060 TaxID=2587096 RepID=UPI0016194E5F|nr:FAD-binding protein [Rhizobium sp. BK060]MBB3396045.1 glycolate oxidase FAD binding subunit [Rhizobium sp. BK060]